MQTVTFLNQKGGVGKSSCTHHLGGTLAAMGKRVLLVDADPQSSLTQGLLGPKSLESIHPSQTMAAILNGDDPYAEDVVRPSGLSGVDLLPGSESYAHAIVGDPWTASYEVQRRLASVLTELAPRYDVCLIDCQPTYASPSWAALAAADALVVPLQPEDYGSQGIRGMIRVFETVREGVNPRLRLAGYLITMINTRLSIHNAFETRIREGYGNDVFATMIPYATDFKESISHRLPINLYKPRSASAKVFRALADELLARLACTIAEVA